uniref:Copia protein n=1 Tax=Cajanus cajan TaxID=3821 RepID=A0A151TTM5_CAJCA|nr:hypothetical protein KK1_009592 [Cajanus cajan]
MEEPRAFHFQGAKIIIRYIKGILTNKIFYTSNNDVKVVGYTNGDWAGDVRTRNNVSRYAFYLGTGTI